MATQTLDLIINIASVQLRPPTDEITVSFDLKGETYTLVKQAQSVTVDGVEYASYLYSGGVFDIYNSGISITVNMDIDDDGIVTRVSKDVIGPKTVQVEKRSIFGYKYYVSENQPSINYIILASSLTEHIVLPEDTAVNKSIVLYRFDEYEFTSMGLGVLRDAISCKVTEERNGIFEIELEYPEAGIHADEIETDYFLKCKPNPYSPMQIFRIYSVEKDMEGTITVSGRHISYDLANHLANIPEVGNSLDFYDELQLKADDEHVGLFKKFKTDIYYSYSISSNAKNYRDLLVGSDNSSLSIYGGEFYFDNFDVYQCKNRGSNNGYILSHKKNVTGLDFTIDSSGVYDIIHPIWYKDGVEVHGYDVYTTDSYLGDGSPTITDYKIYNYDTTGGTVYSPVPMDTDILQRQTLDYLVANRQSLIDQGYTHIYGSWRGYARGHGSTALTISCNYIYTVSDSFAIPVDLTNHTITMSALPYKHVPSTVSHNVTKEELDQLAENFIETNRQSIIKSSGMAFGYYYFANYRESSSRIFDKIEFSKSYDWKRYFQKGLKVFTLDCSSSFSTEPTKEQLAVKAAEYAVSNNLYTPEVNINVSFEDLSRTADYEQYQPLERLMLCDVIRLYMPRYNIDIHEKVMKTEYDVLNAKYISLELGSLSSLYYEDLQREAEQQKRMQQVEDQAAQSGQPTDPQGVYYGIGENVAATTDISDGTVTVNLATFKTQITTYGTYEFIRSGDNWTYNDSIVNLANYGITVTGTPVDGNKITVILSDSQMIQMSVSPKAVLVYSICDFTNTVRRRYFEYTSTYNETNIDGLIPIDKPNIIEKIESTYAEMVADNPEISGTATAPANSIITVAVNDTKVGDAVFDKSSLIVKGPFNAGASVSTFEFVRAENSDIPFLMYKESVSNPSMYGYYCLQADTITQTNEGSI